MKVVSKPIFYIPIFILIVAFTVFTIIQSTRVLADSKGNTIAGIEVDGLDREEIEQALQSAIALWQSEPLVVEGGGYKVELDKTLVQFDVTSTIDTYENLIKQPWYAFWEDEQVIQLPLEFANSDLIRAEIEKIIAWDTDITVSNILGQASFLKSEIVEAEVGDYSSLENERLALEILDIPVEARGVYELAIALDETIVAPGDVFSFIEELQNTMNSTNSEGASFVASLLYSTVLKTNSEIYERHSQTIIPDYLEAGMEAFVSNNENKDFKFLNTSELPLLIKSSIEANKLKIELYSSAKVDEVTVRVVASDEIQPKIITRYSEELAIGSSKVLEEGKKGLRVFVYRTINGEEQTPIRDYYAPENRIILKSSRVLQQPASSTGSDTSPSNESTDPDLNLDLNNDGFPDEQENEDIDDENLEVDEKGNTILPEGWYYDKAGNLIKR